MKRRENRVLPAFVAILFCSGAAGLGYQIVWTKAFGAGIGHEYPAVLAVVTAFMSGMALGALLYDCLPGKLQNVGSAYGWLELLIAVWGAATAYVIPFLNRVVLHALGDSPSEPRHWTVVFALVFVGLLPATTAMGATLPAMERLLFSITSRGWTGFLYSANTAGAMAGALVAAFWLMPVFGLRGSILIFAALNFACAVGALLLAGGGTVRPREPAKPSYSLAALLFLSGVFGIGFETLIVRALSHILESTVYTFAILLAVYLLGTALGAAAFHAFAGKNVSVRKLFPALAFSCLLSAIFLKWLPAFYLHLRVSFGESLAAVAAAEFLIGACAFVIPSVFMGATFSALAQTSLQFHRSLGWSVALNSFGSALAPAIFGLLLVPQLGLRFSLTAVVLGYAALAQRSALWLIPSCALLVPFVTSGTELVIHPNQKLVFFREGAMASVAVLESTNNSRVLKVNNRFQMGGTAARIAEERHADIPLLLHPKPTRALFIGLGTGITFATAANYPDLKADGVELLPEVAQAMPFFQDDPRALKNPALRVHVADGRRFVLTTTNRYDVIVGDLFHPAQDGAGFLYTREHFSAVRNCLAVKGLFSQWLPLYQMDLTTVDLIANTFRAVFPVSEMWLLRFNVDTPVIGLIGWTERPVMSVNSVEQKAASSDRLREHLYAVALGDTLRLFGCRLGELRAASSLALNTDENPLVLFKAPYVTFREHDDPGARLLKLIDRGAREPLLPPISVGDDQFVRRLSSYVHARNVYLRGLVQENNGDIPGAINLYVESAKLSPEFTSGYAQVLGIATTLARRNPHSARTILEQLIEAQPDRPVARQLLEKLNAQ